LAKGNKISAKINNKKTTFFISLLVLGSLNIFCYYNIY